MGQLFVDILFLGNTVLKNPPASAGDTGDVGSIPELGRCPGEGKWQCTLVFLAWKIPWTEEPGGLQSMGSESDMT